MRFQYPFETVTTTVDGRILATLARVDHWFAIADLHQLLPDLSDPGIRNSIRRLVDIGVVDQLGTGRGRQYRLNRDHLAAGAIVQIASLEDELLDRLHDAMNKWSPPPLFAAIFGSAATHSMGVSSDIDLAIVARSDVDEQWDSYAFRLAEDARRWTGNDVQPLMLREHEIRDAAGVEPVLEDILSEGRFIVGDRGAFRRLVGA